PTGLTNFLESVAMLLFPMALVLMDGRMLGKLKHAWIIFSVMMILMVTTVVWSVYFDTYKPNPGLTSHPVERKFELGTSGGEKTLRLSAGVGVARGQHLGKIERKGMGVGASSRATFAPLTGGGAFGGGNCAPGRLTPKHARLS